MKSSPFHRPTRLESAYQYAINSLLKKFFKLPTFETLGELNARLVEYANAQDFLEHFASKAATNMVTMVAVNNAKSWRQAATEASKGRYIYSILQRDTQGVMGMKLQEMIQENSKLISTLPRNIASQVSAKVQAEQMKGRRSEDIIKDIYPYATHLKQYEVQRIARTEVAKADTALTRVRANNIGLNWYQWQTSEDARVRDSHKKMDQVLINWNDAPSPELLDKEKSQGHYHAGNIYNCRCVALPIVTLNSIEFPAKVYSNGSIRRMSKKQFVIESGIPLYLAA